MILLCHGNQLCVIKKLVAIVHNRLLIANHVIANKVMTNVTNVGRVSKR